MKHSIDLLKKSSELKNQAASIKHVLSDKLLEHLKGITDRQTQNLLSNVRRDLFNERGSILKHFNQVKDHLSTELLRLFQNYIDLSRESNETLTTYQKAFNQDLIQVREQFRNHTKSPVIGNGLILSSQSLLERMESYLHHDINNLNKKDIQIENSLMKYLSRTCAKTSPFSTFTNVSLVSIDDEGSKNNQSGNQVVSHIRLNNMLYQYLIVLLTIHPEIRRTINIRRNPTIQIENDQYLFLTNNQNIESFQRIPTDPAVELFLELLEDKDDHITYQEYIDDIITGEYIDADEEGISQYLDQLIEYGMIEFDFGVSGIDPDWDVKLRAKLLLTENKIESVAALNTTLKSMRDLAAQYEQSPIEKRLTILESAHADFKNACLRIHKEAGLPEKERLPREELAELTKKEQEEEKMKAEATKDTEKKEEKEPEAFKHRHSTYFAFKPEQVFYEDTTTNRVLNLHSKGIKDLAGILHGLLAEIRVFDYKFDEMTKMTTYFVNKYLKRDSVPLMQFYEDYYREFKKPEKEEIEKLKESKDGAKQKKKKEVVKIQELKNQADLRIKWQKALKKKILDKRKDKVKTDEILLYHQDLIDVNNSLGLKKERKELTGSYGAFLQIFQDDKRGSKLSCVVNGTFPGFGKMFSRFMHLFDERLTKELVSWNSNDDTISMLLETHDASFFNANLHPPLMPYEVRMPNGNNTLPVSRQVPVTDIIIHFNKKSESLELWHTSKNKRLYCFDLGFQGIKGRSELFQMLSQFSKFELLSSKSLTNVISDINIPKNAKNMESEVIVIPRIWYEDALILQRKSWLIPKEQLPVKLSGESPDVYFRKVNEWKESLNLPDNVFVFLTSPNSEVKQDQKEKPKLGRDDYKPQYISFKNPILVQLLAKMINKVSHKIRIEEMVPAPDQLLTCEGKPYVSESVVQWYC